MTCTEVPFEEPTHDAYGAPLGDGKGTITTLIFDVDDTLYDVGNGFTAHRNGGAVAAFMVAHLKFESEADALALRDEYFARYHSTVKALTVAEADGRLPASAHFDAAALAEWWATKLDFERFIKPEPQLIKALAECPLRLVAFSNSPRAYCLRTLEALGLRHLFPDECVFAVDDVMPHCKPEPAAFDKVLSAVGAPASACVLIEDSMKNIRAAKALGLRTLLVSGLGTGDASAGEATKPGDAPQVDDPAVDASVRSCAEIRAVLPGLWQTPATFEVVRPPTNSEMPRPS